MFFQTINPIVLLWLVICVLPWQANANDTTRPELHRPNIILIVSDNQSPSLLGVYGNSDINTPNIDDLANDGVVFTNAYAASGVCSPTRATLMTGLLPSQTGVHNALPSNTHYKNWSAIAEFRSLPQTLSQIGYKTALIGKYHLGAHEQAQLGFDYWLTLTTGHTKTFHNVEVIDNGSHYRVPDHLTDFWTRKAVDYIARQSVEVPFFLMITYNGPYMLPPSVTNAPNSRHKDRYTKRPPASPQHPVHPFLENWARGRSPSGDMKNESTHAWAAIRALNNKTAMINTASETTMVDDGVGEILSALKHKQLLDETLIVYTSDQGSSWGQHGLWGNTSWAYPFPAYDSHLKVPLIVRSPKRLPKGFESERIINQFDLFPTILDFIGCSDINIDNTPGKSFLPLLTADSSTWDDTAFFEFITVRGLRTRQWKYVKRFPAGPDELYNMIKDPEETNNLIALSTSGHEAVIAALRARLDVFFNSYADPKYDLWKGGTAKGRLIEDYGMNHIFAERFPNWKSPYIEQVVPFSD